MKDILSLVERVARRQGPSDDADLRDYCLATQLSLREFSNKLALTLATGFHEEQLPYEFCDEVLNYLFNFVMEPQFLESEQGMPQPAFEIFQAFDATEYYRDSVPPKVDAVMQYTRPRIAEILGRQAARLAAEAAPQKWPLPGQSTSAAPLPSDQETPTMAGNTVRLHRVLRAPPERVYRAFLTAEALAKWLPPHGFTATLHEMDARVGGRFRMSFTNFTTGQAHSFGGEYLELVPQERIRYTDVFDDPNLPGEMHVTITLRAVSCGTELDIVQEGIPEMIPVEMCYLGWQESLALLTLLVEPEIRQ